MIQLQFSMLPSQMRKKIRAKSPIQQNFFCLSAVLAQWALMWQASSKSCVVCVQMCIHMYVCLIVQARCWCWISSHPQNPIQVSMNCCVFKGKRDVVSSAYHLELIGALGWWYYLENSVLVAVAMDSLETVFGRAPVNWRPLFRFVHCLCFR